MTKEIKKDRKQVVAELRGKVEKNMKDGRKNEKTREKLTKMFERIEMCEKMRGSSTNE